MENKNQRLAGRLPQSWIGWLLLGALLMCTIIVAGGLAGGLLFPLVGSLLKFDLSIGEMVKNGVLDGAFFAAIWAPGLSFVACLMMVNWKRRTMDHIRGKALDTGD